MSYRPLLTVKYLASLTSISLSIFSISPPLHPRYGVGYHLTLVKDSVDMTDSQAENLTTFIQSHVSSAECHSNVGSELSYLLNASQVGAFSDLFEVCLYRIIILLYSALFEVCLYHIIILLYRTLQIFPEFLLKF